MKNYFYTFVAVLWLFCSINITAKNTDSSKDPIDIIIKELTNENISRQSTSFILQEWQENGFKKINKNKLNIICKIAAQNAKNFPYEKYFVLSKAQRAKLSPKTKTKVRNKSMSLFLLAIGYTYKDTAAIAYEISIRQRPFHGDFLSQINACKKHLRRLSEVQLFTRASRIKLNVLIKMLESKNCHEKLDEKISIISSTEDKVFMKQLKNHQLHKNRVIRLCKRVIKQAQKQEYQEFRLEIISKLHNKLATKHEQLKWYIALLQNESISNEERNIIRKRISLIQEQLKQTASLN
ncbi:hypothetical protein AAEX28_09310 [Lentisphaerota bacterium WC36G]|nr:hypothetical protein LJT99_12155 [Lentisphaerae bacterium WC36]